MQSRSKVQVYKCGWINVAYSLRYWLFSLESSLSLFFETWLPLFFWVMLLCHPIFSLFGATIIWLYFISGMFNERDHQDMEHLLMWTGWMVVLIPSVGMLQMDGSCTCLWSWKHDKHLTRVTQFDKTQQNIKQHCVRFFMEYDIWLW